MADAQQNHVRPTEAQLRWAGFQFKSRAVRVRSALDQFYLRPNNVHDVEGAVSEDGNTTEESSASEVSDGGSGGGECRRKPKPRISRGRRAMIRVSRRKFEQRRAEIERNGFSVSGDRDNEEGNVDAIFAGGESFQKRRKKRRNHRKNKDADRVHRFEAAFHSMMKNLEASQKPQHVIETPTRIWTRPEGADSMKNIDYSAMKTMGSHQKIHNPQSLPCHLPVDRGASWLVHMPERMTTAHHYTHGPERPKMIYPQPQSSPNRKGFKDIVTEFQHRPHAPSLQHRQAPTMKVSKYFVPANLEGYDSLDNSESPGGDLVRARVAALGRQQTQDQLDSVIHSIDPQLLKEMEELDPGVTERLRSLYLGDDSPPVQVKACTKFKESPKDGKTEQPRLVQKFVASIEKALGSNQENLVAADGKLHKAAFARLVNQYLLETGGTPRGSPLSNGQRKTNHTKHKKNSQVSTLADTILAKLGGSGEEENHRLPFLDAKGGFDKQAFEALVTRYLSEATGIDEKTVRQLEDFESLACMSLNGQSSMADEHNAHIQSIANHLALDLTELVEPLAMQKHSSIYPVSPQVEAIVRSFLVDNCGVHPDEFEKESEVELFCTVVNLRDAAVYAIENAQQYGTFDRDDFVTHARRHFARFFDESMAQLPDADDVRSSLVQKLISRIQQTSPVQQLVTREGTIDVSTIAKFMKRYLKAASRQREDDSGHSPLALAQARRAAGSRRNRGDDANTMLDHPLLEHIQEKEASQFVARCIQDLEFRAREEIIVSADGTVDELRLVQILQKSFNPEYLNISHMNTVDDTGDYNTIKTPAKSTVSEFSSNSVSEVHTADSSSKLAGNIVGSVKKSFGGFVRRLYHVDEDASSDLKAYSNFRRSQDSSRMSLDSQRDDASQSSFLSMGLRSAVKKLGLGSPDNSDMAERTHSSNHALLTNLMGTVGNGKSIIDTDGNESEMGHPGMNPERMKSLMLSPALLTKRHRQAIRSIENRLWGEVQYLISANPWLAEMSDVNTKQYLLHKLALYGAGEAVVNEDGMVETRGAAPQELNEDMVRLFPSSVHKFDQEGNLPLHMAAASANVAMAMLLGDRFPSGATVRNEDGLLPLHLSLLACASPQTTSYGNAQAAGEMVQTILGYFPGAVAVTDDEGNLPIHTAASVLRGDVGVDAIYILFDEAERQLKDSTGVRFRNKPKLEDFENMSIDTETTVTPTDASNNLDDALHCTMVRNDMGEIPLFCAIHSSARCEVIDALLHGPCGHQSALAIDGEGNNALHLLLDERYQDPASALSVLKVAPEAACVRNNYGMLPIELACINSLPLEVIMAIVLVDLPIDIDRKEFPQQRPGFGSSWWYITCECDDHYTEIVDEIVAICAVDQVRELAFMENGAGESLLSRAAPESKEILQCSLRYLGRFEIKHELPLSESSASEGVTLFEAIDFGFAEDSSEGIDVFLKFFPDQKIYDSETVAIRELGFEFDLVEEVFAFDTGELGDGVFDDAKRFCLCIEKPQLTLAGVVDGMMKNDCCQNDPETRRRYGLKALSVLNPVAKALAHIHSLGVVHGNLSVDSVGKYDTLWKLAGMSGLQKIGNAFHTSRVSFAVPPEAISQPDRVGSSKHEVIFRQDLAVSAAMDSWGFGKLAYEVLFGKPLVAIDKTKDVRQNHEALVALLHWNDFNLKEIRGDLSSVGCPESGIDLIVACLSPEAQKRPSAVDIVDHALWLELHLDQT